MKSKSLLRDLVTHYRAITTVSTVENFDRLYSTALDAPPSQDSWVASIQLGLSIKHHNRRWLLDGNCLVFMPVEIVDRVKIARAFTAFNPYPEDLMVMRVGWGAFRHGSMFGVRVLSRREHEEDPEEIKNRMKRVLKGFLLMWSAARLGAFCKREHFDQNTLRLCQQLRSKYHSENDLPVSSEPVA